jgi:hypothetical protein
MTGDSQDEERQRLFARNLRAARERAGLTQATIATKLRGHAGCSSTPSTCSTTRTRRCGRAPRTAREEAVTGQAGPGHPGAGDAAANQQGGLSHEDSMGWSGSFLRDKLSVKLKELTAMSRYAFGSGVIVLTVCGVAAIAFAAADWSAAERKFEEFRREHEQLRRLTPDETKKIVAAVCEAEEEDRQSVAKDASQRVRDKIEDEYEDLEEIRGDALELLDAVLADSAQKDRHSKAKEHRGKVTEWWTSIEKMTRSLRGANHPVVAFMLKEGQAAHKGRQTSSSYCDVSAFRMSSGEADCLKASGCKVIELEPDNSRAISAGRNQAQSYAAELNRKGDAFNSLVKKDSDFAKCTRFETQIDCYTLCPDINDNGEFRSAAPRWRERC